MNERSCKNTSITHRVRVPKGGITTMTLNANSAERRTRGGGLVIRGWKARILGNESLENDCKMRRRNFIKFETKLGNGRPQI